MATQVNPLPQKSSKIAAFISVVLVVLLGLLTGFLSTLYFDPGQPPSKAETSSSEPNQGRTSTEAPDGEHPPRSAHAVLTLPPMVTNLAEPATAWIRLEASVTLVTELESSELNILAPKLSDSILAYLRTVRLADVDEPTELQFLAEDLQQITELTSSGAAQDILLTSLVVE
jgi:flagellar protein FliL